MESGGHSARIHARTTHAVGTRSGDFPRALALFWFAVLGLVGAPAAPPAHAASTSYSLTFQTSGQDMWNSGSQYMLDYSQPWGTSWNQSSSGGSYQDITIPGYCIPKTIQICDPLPPYSCTTVTVPGEQICFPEIDLGSFGAEASASTDGTVSLQPHLTVRGGGIDVTYPIQVTLGLPADGVLYPGDTYTISTSFVPNGTASLSSSSPSARITLDALLNAHFSSSATVKGGDALGTKSGTLFDFSVGSPNPVQIFNSDNPVFLGAVNYGVNAALSKLTEGLVSGSFNQLAINTNGGLASNGTSLLATGDANFFNASVDYTCAVLLAAGVPCPEQNFSLDLGPTANFSANLQILDLFQSVGLGLHQRFQFDPHPKVHLVLSNGETLDGNLGDTWARTFPIPADNATSNDLTIMPTFRLDNQFRNTTQLSIDPTLNLVPLNVSYSGKAAGQDLGSFSLQPVDTLTLPAQVPPATLFDSTFALPGLQASTGTPASIRGYVYPAPVLDSVTPAVSKPGATLHFAAAGQNFVQSHANTQTSLPSTTALWNGDSRLSTLDTSTGQVTFDITSDEANAEGIFNVTVANPAPGGGTSNAKPVIIDGHPPVTTISLSGPQNANNNGWYKGEVSASLSSQDTLSGVHDVEYQVDGGAPQTVLTHAPLGPGSFNAPGFPVSGDGIHSVTYGSNDNAGNAETQRSAGIKIDGTPPTVTYSGNAGSYTVDQQVNITCASADNLSGVLSDTCRPITGPAYSFPLGVNSFSATATDKAGNVGRGSTSFTVQVTYDSLCTLVQQFVTKPGVAHSLCVKLQNAAADAARGDLNAKSGIMGAFANEVQAQSGKAMTTDQAAILTQLALAV